MELDKQREARFQAYTDEVIRIEGGYVNDPVDPGGETKYGITLNTARRFGYNGRMIDLTKEEAKEIYRKGYWNNTIAPYIAHDVAFNYYLLMIHAGQRQATKILQRAVGVEADGVAGVKTMNAISQKSPEEIAGYLYFETLDFYVSISPNTKYKYLKGWRNRLRAAQKINWERRIAEYV